jgi:hypothetical protein
VCRRILEQHGGSIEAESRPGHGATFRLHLPRNGAMGVRNLCDPSSGNSPAYALEPALAAPAESGARP